VNSIDLLYPNDTLTYTNIRNYEYDTSVGIVWFTDQEGYKHEFKGRWHFWESK
jgi:hypothetical protein